MTRTMIKLQPQTGLLVAASVNFTHLDQEVLINYYQPLLNPTALGLFYALKSRLVPQITLSSRIPHTDLLDQIGVDIVALDEGRRFLEGVGLMKTFFRVDELGPVALYQLQPPLSPAAFINDDLLSVLLLQRIGTNRYEKLAKRASQYSLPTAGFREVTASFLDVFQSTNLKLDQAQVKTAQAMTISESEPQTSSFDIPIDWNFLKQQVAAFGITETELSKHRQLIMAEKMIYGMNELRLATLLARAADLEGHLDPSKFKLLVRQSVGQRPNLPKKETSLENSLGNDASKKNKLTVRGRQLVDQADRCTPFQYLMALKEGTNSGFVSSAEKNTLERLANHSSFSNGAINVLTHYIIVEQGKANLTANLANAIANSWTRQGVRSAVDAVTAIEHYRDKSVSSHRNKHRRRVIREKLPEWAKHLDQ